MCYCKHFAGSFYESVIMKYSYKSKTLEIFKNHLEIILTLSAYYNFLKWQKFIGNQNIHLHLQKDVFLA